MKKHFVFAFMLLFLFSCKNDTKQEKDKEATENKTEVYKVSNVKIDSTLFENCGGIACPKINVDYLELEGEGDFAQSINKTNTQELIELLHIDKEKPKANSIKEAINDFGEDYFEVKKAFPDSEDVHELKIAQQVKSKNESTLVLETGFYMYTGGAHGYGGTRFLNFDAETGEYLTKDDLIKDIPAFTDFVEKAFRRQYEIPPQSDINDYGFFFEDGKFALPENMAVTDEAVILIYNPYEAASYSQGALRLFFPKKTVGKWFAY